MAVIVRGARRGKWDGRHVSDRAGRRVPPLIPGRSLGLGFVVLPERHAPAALVSPAASMLVSLPVTDVITVGAKVKISRHAAVAAAAVVVPTPTYGPWALPPALPVAWVVWPRIALRDHTSPEVLAGSVMGVVVGGGGYWGPLAAAAGRTGRRFRLRRVSKRGEPGATRPGESPAGRAGPVGRREDPSRRQPRTAWSPQAFSRVNTPCPPASTVTGRAREPNAARVSRAQVLHQRDAGRAGPPTRTGRRRRRQAVVRARGRPLQRRLHGGEPRQESQAHQRFPHAPNLPSHRRRPGDRTGPASRGGQSVNGPSRDSMSLDGPFTASPAPRSRRLRRAGRRPHAGARPSGSGSRGSPGPPPPRRPSGAAPPGRAGR